MLIINQPMQTKDYKDKSGFQILICGIMWISVVEGNFRNLHSRRSLSGGVEYLEDVSVLWTDCCGNTFIDK